MKFIGLAVTLLLATYLPTAALEREGTITQGIASVIDGDTLEIHGSRIRLHGIDALESRQACTKGNGSAWRCGQAAALELADKISRTPVLCEHLDMDRYGRIIARCFSENEDLNRWMVSEGLAVAYRQYSSDYIADETRAREARKGIWRRNSTCLGTGAEGLARPNLASKHLRSCRGWFSARTPAARGGYAPKSEAAKKRGGT